MNATSLRRLLPVLVVVVIGFVSRSADARRGVIVFNHGDSIDHVADLDPEARSEVESELGVPAAIGYKYSSFGLFWLDLWSWDGSYVLYHEDNYWEVREDVLAELAGVPSIDELGKPWGYRFPPGLVILVAAIIGGVVFLERKRRRQKRIDAHYERAQELLRDDRYQTAVDRMNGLDGDRITFEQAVDHLESEGVPRAEARRHLSTILAAQAEVQAA